MSTFTPPVRQQWDSLDFQGRQLPGTAVRADLLFIFPLEGNGKEFKGGKPDLLTAFRHGFLMILIVLRCFKL